MREKRMMTRGGFIEAPTNTYTLTPDADITTATGVTEFSLVANTDGSFTADIVYTFTSNGVAEDFRANGAAYILCSEYAEKGADMPAAVDTTISDSLIFPNAEQYDEFLRQVKGDLSLELVLPLPYYK